MAVDLKESIVHEIPKGRSSSKSDVEVTLSSDITPLERETRRFLEDQVMKFSLKKPRMIKEDPESGIDTPSHIRKLLKSDAEFVAASQQLARRLFQAQTANSPSGILIVARADVDGNSSAIILKAEHQEGMRLKRQKGSERLDLEHLNELIVGKNSRIYKIAAMHILEDESLFGKMVDAQNGAEFADFFLVDFLGCALADRSEVQTKIFVNAAMEHFNEIDSYEKSSKYTQSLVAYMRSPQEEFQAGEFADQFIEPDDRDDFLRAVPESVGDGVIRKDMSLVPGKGAGLKFVGDGFTMVASSDAFESGAVSVTEEPESGTTVIRLTGEFRQISFGAPPKGTRL